MINEWLDYTTEQGRGADPCSAPKHCLEKGRFERHKTTDLCFTDVFVKYFVCVFFSLLLYRAVPCTSLSVTFGRFIETKVKIQETISF